MLRESKRVQLMIKEIVSLVLALALWMSIACISQGVALAQDVQNQNSAASTKADWQRYTIKDEQFSALLPTVPAMSSTERMLSPTRERRERVIGAYANGVVYAVHTFKYNESPSLDEIVAEFRVPIEGFKRELNLGNFRGKEYAQQLDDVKGVSQFYIQDKKVYVFRVFGSSLGEVASGTPKFLDSIKLEKDPQGQPISEGHGIQEAPLLKAEEILSGRLVTKKVRVFTKPEPTYTALARKNAVTGTVVIRCVFSAYGTVTNLIVVSGLADGLDQQALAAARQIRFIPAIKDGRFASMWMELQYNFNLY